MELCAGRRWQASAGRAAGRGAAGGCEFGNQRGTVPTGQRAAGGPGSRLRGAGRVCLARHSSQSVRGRQVRGVEDGAGAGLEPSRVALTLLGPRCDLGRAAARTALVPSVDGCQAEGLLRPGHSLPSAGPRVTRVALPASLPHLGVAGGLQKACPVSFLTQTVPRAGHQLVVSLK